MTRLFPSKAIGYQGLSPHLLVPLTIWVANLQKEDKQ
jgi:hypothetical protein